MNDEIKDQPAPIPNDSASVWDLVITDMKARDQVGRERYGTPLQAGNGRNHLVDAYQESLDKIVYLRAEIEERLKYGTLEEHRQRLIQSIDKQAELMHPEYGGCDGFRDGGCSQCANVVEELKRRFQLQAKELNEVEQILGKALSYPELYEALDIEKGMIACGPDYPNAKPTGTICVGDHVPATLAQEAANRIRSTEEEVAHLHGIGLPNRPKIVCFCGSTRFTAQMLILKWEREKKGEIVLSWNALPDSYFKGARTNAAEQEGVKEQIDELHKRKIDLADTVFVINIDGYVGESTRSEIDYAVAHGKPVFYLEAPWGGTTGKLHSDESVHYGAV